MEVSQMELSPEERALSEVFFKSAEEMKKVIYGQGTLIESFFITLLSSGHLLVEGLPGLAKTLASLTFSRIISCSFKRIQFTPDLLPADLLGSMMYNPKELSFFVSKGPIFTQILLADEINRAPPKVQSALLEAMQEKQVTIGGETYPLLDPYVVIATQNPLDQEGTYPLPEAQIDRFLLKVLVNYPTREEEEKMIKGENLKPSLEPLLNGEIIEKAKKIVQKIHLEEKFFQFILDIVFATREDSEFKKYIDCGASPRASLALKRASQAYAFLHGRGEVSSLDIKKVAYLVLRHRIKLSYLAEAEGINSDAIIDKIFEKIVAP